MEYVLLSHPNKLIAAAQKAMAGFIDDPDKIFTLNRRVRRALPEGSDGVMDFLATADKLREGKGIENERAMRHERRQSVAHIMAAFLHYADMQTYNVQIPVKHIAKMTGYCCATVSRCLEDLRAAGIMITIKRPRRAIRDRNGKMWDGAAAIRKISVAFFSVLGLGKQFEHASRRWGRTKRLTHYEQGVIDIAQKQRQSFLRLPPGAPAAYKYTAFVTGGHQQDNKR